MSNAIQGHPLGQLFGTPTVDIPYLAQVVYAVLQNATDDNLIKAGTLGSRVTNAIRDGQTYNKPLIGQVLQYMQETNNVSSGRSFPGLQLFPGAGARIRADLRPPQRSVQSPAIAQQLSESAEKIIPKPDPPRLESRLPKVEGRAVGPLVFKKSNPIAGFYSSPCGLVTVPLSDSCCHENIMAPNPTCQPRCIDCGQRFTVPVPKETIFG